jgi:hypothetical protein
MSFRNLNQIEIDQLENQGCQAADWKNVLVDPRIQLAAIENVRFAGQIRISSGVQIRNVGLLQNYAIEKDVHIENIFSLMTVGETCFGNGLKISVLNEAGGRELILYDRLSAQIAYMMVCYRYDESFISALEGLVLRYVSKMKSRMGCVGTAARILNTHTIKNVSIGPCTMIENSILLEEGTILSNQGAPVVIGEGVNARNFIVQSGSRIDGGVLILNCFIGQAVQMGKQFSAENSAFFANSEAFHSEACSVFAGPYTVSHHRSTLLIAGLYSFYNAGSGTNQSNHMYKLGPVHQGILERGAKTGSNAYMIWPSHVGAYSVILGEHHTNIDISEFPFSYLTEENGRSMLAPALNLFMAGTKRDSRKWPTRDRREDSEKYDLINFELFNPYIVNRILKAKEKLTELSEKNAREKELIPYKGVYIKRLLLKQAVKIYDLVVKSYIGNELIQQLLLYPDLTFEDLKNKMKSKNARLQEWYDLSGMFISETSRRDLFQSIQSVKIKDINELSRKLQDIFMNYRTQSWSWCSALIEARLEKSIITLTKSDMIALLEDWKNSVLRLNNMVLHDAEKEFGASSMIGYGLDGSSEDIDKDFQAVRGDPSTDAFIRQLKEESETVSSDFEKLSAQIQRI